jgi:transcriptional regulator with XRE-family HTH domain
MNLDEYLFRTKQSKTSFAQKLGISRGHLQHILNGSRRPSVSLAKKIEEITEGKVSKAEVLFPEDFQAEDN